MIPLINHSSYSMMKGAVTIDSLVAAAKTFNLPALALSDENGMYGLINFFKRCVEEGIKPILGAHIDDPSDTSQSAVLLVKNNEGYSELCKIITSRKLNEDFKLHNVLNTLSGNFFVITSSLDLLREIKHNSNLYIPLRPSKKFRKENRELYNYAIENNIGLIAANPAYFLSKEDFFLHKVLTAVRLNTTLDNITPECVDEESYFINPQEIRSFFKSVPAALENTILIADQCNVDLKAERI
jgi:DNA polymerase III alpha subunit